MAPAFPRRALAVMLVVTTVLAVTVSPILSSDGSSVSGRVVNSDGVTPRPGVVVALLDVESRTEYRSEPSGDEGAFLIDEAPAGTYRLLAETEQGAFLAANEFEVLSGSNRPVSLALNPQTDPGGGGGGGDPAAAGQQAGKGGLPTWARWVIAGGILVVGILVIEELTKTDEQNVSAFD